MSITITDPGLLAQFAQASGEVELIDPSGRVLGRFLCESNGQLLQGVKSPITDEAFEEARKQPDGLPLSEVWKRIHERDGS